MVARVADMCALPSSILPTLMLSVIVRVATLGACTLFLTFITSYSVLYGGQY